MTSRDTTDVHSRFEDLARRAGPRVLAYLGRRTDPRDDAVDVHQRVLLTAWRRIDDIPLDDEAAVAWLIGVARRELANHRRSGTRRLAATERLRAALSVGSGTVGGSRAGWGGWDAGAGPSAAVGEAGAAYDTGPELTERLRHALAILPETDQEIVTLAYWDGLTGEQIGVVLGLSAAAVRKRLQRAREALRARLDMGTARGERVRL